jgi:5-methyltetrahydrofolate--homocysteine methyltransferase
VLSEFDLDRIFPYLNPAMLYNRHLGLRGKLDRLLAEGDRKAEGLHRNVLELQAEAVARKLLRPKAVYKFFQAGSEGDDLVLLNPDRREAARFHFLRQKSGDSLCLADFAAPLGAEPPDTVCLFVTTCGGGIRELAEDLKRKGEYLKSHALQALALESAEAFAELLHHRIREMWGIKDPETMTMEGRWQARYQGIRVSFGYPACPRLEDQDLLFRLLEPEKHIGVSLTEEHMMDPRPRSRPRPSIIPTRPSRCARSPSRSLRRADDRQGMGRRRRADRAGAGASDDDTRVRRIARASLFGGPATRNGSTCSSRGLKVRIGGGPGVPRPRWSGWR